MTPELQLPAPAKLNLMLHVLGRRADGYHELQTLFQFLDHSDELRLRLDASGDIRLTGDLAGVAEEQNLITRAARLLQQASGCTLGAQIQVRKVIPMGAGLGGGSSDAATALIGLNRLWDTGLSLVQLASLGLRLGADVPVFVQGHAAWAEGVGERLTPVQLEQPWFLVVTPLCQVSTAEIFCHSQLTRHSPPITIAAALEQGGRNDCEPLVRQLYPEVDQALNWLDQYAKARLTGTGASIFAGFPTRTEAEVVLARLPRPYSGFVARGLNLSPLHQAAKIDADYAELKGGS